MGDIKSYVLQLSSNDNVITTWSSLFKTAINSRGTKIINNSNDCINPMYWLIIKYYY